jgi:hypothetical protein
LTKERQPGERVAQAHQGEVEDHHQRQQRQAAVAVQRGAVLQPDEDGAGHDRGEDQQHPVENLQRVVKLRIAMQQQILAVLVEHLDLLRGDPRARLDDGLAALHLHRHRLERLERVGLLLPGGGDVVVEVGGDAVAEKPEEREGEVAGRVLVGQHHAQVGEGVGFRAHAEGGHGAVGPGDLEDGELARIAGGGKRAVIRHPRGGQVAQQRIGVVEKPAAGGRVARRKNRLHVPGAGTIGALGVEGPDEGLQFGRPVVGEPHAGAVGLFEPLQAREEPVGGGLEPEQLGAVEPEHRRHALAELFAGEAGFLRAHIGERRAGHHAHAGQLVGQHGQIGGRDPHEADEHDGGDRGRKDERRHQPAGFDKLLRPRAGRAEEELELLAEGHGERRSGAGSLPTLPEVDDGDDAHGGGRHGVDDAIGWLMDFLQLFPGVFVDGMAAAGCGEDGFSAFDDACDSAVGIELRVARDEAADGAQLLTGFGGPCEFHAVRPNSRRTDSWGWTRPARMSASPASIFWRT